MRGSLAAKGAIVLAAAISLLACAKGRSGVQAGEPLYGSWVNEEYGSTSRIDFAPDGKGLVYNRGAKEPHMEWRVSIAERWTDDNGNTCYKVTIKGSGYPYNEAQASGSSMWYGLLRINPARDAMEMNTSPSEYPTEINKQREYGIRYRK